MTNTESPAKLYRGRDIPERFSKANGRFRGQDARHKAEAWALKEYVAKGRDAAVLIVTMDGDGPMDDNWAPGAYILLDPAQG